MLIRLTFISSLSTVVLVVFLVSSLQPGLQPGLRRVEGMGFFLNHVVRIMMVLV